MVGSVAACRGEQAEPAPTSQESGVTQSAPADGAVEGFAVGGRMPAYAATTLDGRPFNLTKDKVVLVNIWATWCGPCRVEIPELQVLHDKYGARGFEVIGVSIDDPGSDAVVRDYVREQKMTYPVVLDPQGRIADLFQTTVIPTSALIDRSGTIRWIHRGIVRAADPALLAAMDTAIGG